jgi:hypothetical protein
MQGHDRGRARHHVLSWAQIVAAGGFDTTPPPFRWRESACFAHPFSSTEENVADE